MRGEETFVYNVCLSATLPLWRYWSGQYRLQCARSPLRGAGLTQLAVESVEIPDGLLLALDECLVEIRFIERQRVSPHRHCLDVLLERFGFLECASDGCVVGLFGCSGPRRISGLRHVWLRPAIGA